MAVKFVIIGGGPAGNQAATHAARLGAEVTLIERDVVGGAAHLWDCIPSKTMIATGGAMSFARRLEGMGLDQVKPEIDSEGLRTRVKAIEDRLQGSIIQLLDSHRAFLERNSVDAAALSPSNPEQLAEQLQAEQRAQIAHNLTAGILRKSADGAIRYTWRGLLFIWFQFLRDFVRLH